MIDPNSFAVVDPTGPQCKSTVSFHALPRCVRSEVERLRGIHASTWTVTFVDEPYGTMWTVERSTDPQTGEVEVRACVVVYEESAWPS